MSPEELPPELLFTLLSFIANLLFLTLYFSNVLSTPGSKNTPRKAAFLLSFLGLALAATFSLAAPFFPTIFPDMDVAVGVAVITWILLLHYLYEAGWLEALLEAAVAAIIYIIVWAIASGFFILWVGTG